MRAVVLNPPGGVAENMMVTEVPEAAPGPGEAKVAVSYGGCNFADVMMRRGVYPHPKGYPLVAGIEMAGLVAALGPSVTALKIGDRVAGLCEDAGGFAEYCIVPARRLTVIPRTIGLDQAAAFYVQALTAWHLLHTVSTTAKGDVLLVHAIGGGVGLFLTQLGVQAGAKVIGTTGTAGKERRALEYGATRVINRTQEDFVAAVMQLTGGEGVDKVIDSTGGGILDKSFDCIRPLGHVVSYGEAEGKPFATLWERLVRKSLTFTRMHIGHIDPTSAAWIDGANAVMDAIAAGKLAVPIEGVFPMEKVHDMYARLESRQVAGKLLLKIAASG
jgi:NADPH2:quinone reductase